MKHRLITSLTVAAALCAAACSRTTKETDRDIRDAAAEAIIQKADSGTELSPEDYTSLTDYAVDGFEYGVAIADNGLSRKDIKKNVEQKFPMFHDVINIIEGNEAIGKQNMRRLVNAEREFDDATRN